MRAARLNFNVVKYEYMQRGSVVFTRGSRKATKSSIAPPTDRGCEILSKKVDGWKISGAARSDAA
jgi:hypothetical protein